MRPLLLAALCVAVVLPAFARAEENPRPGKLDPRMRTIAYNPAQVVHLSTAVGTTLSVAFSPDEEVKDVAASDSRDLAVLPARNFLFFKAKTALPSQPVIVLTATPSGALRRYVFAVATVAAPMPGDAPPEVYYSVQFTYPADEAARRHAAATARRTQEQLRAAHDRMDEESRNPFFGPHNWRYVAQGNRSIGPLAVWDNGFSTVFRFPGNIRVPSIFVIQPDGKEATANYTVKGDRVQVDTVARQWRLRDGKTVLCVFNLGYNPIGASPGTGTTSPNVRRVTNGAPP